MESAGKQQAPVCWRHEALSCYIATWQAQLLSASSKFLVKRLHLFVHRDDVAVNEVVQLLAQRYLCQTRK